MLEDGFFKTSGLCQRSFASVGKLKLEREFSAESHYSQDCQDRLWAAVGDGMVFGGGHSEDCIGSPQVASGCYSPQERKRDEACIKSVRGCGSWSRIRRSSKDRNSRSSRKEGGGQLRRLHWLVSDGLWVIVHIEAETLTLDPYYRHPQQDAPTGTSSTGKESGGSRPAASSQSQRL